MTEQGDRFPLSPVQRRRLGAPAGDGGPSGLVALGATLSTDLDRGRLAAAAERLAARYDILRTRLGEGEDGPVQIVGADSRLRLDFCEPDRADGAAPVARLDDALSDRRGASDESTSAVAFRLCRAGSDRWQATLTAPPVLADLSTLAMLLEELVEEASGGDAGAGRGAPLPHARLAAWLADLPATPEAEPGVAYWRRLELGEAGSPEIPFQRAEPSRSLFPAARRERPLPSELGGSLADLAGRLGVSREAIAVAAWTTLLARLSGERRPVLGVNSTGRHRQELAAVAGPLAGALPLVVEVDPASPFVDLVRRIDEELDRARAWQETFDFAHLGGEPGRLGCFPVRFRWLDDELATLADDRILLEDALAIESPGLLELAVRSAAVSERAAAWLSYEASAFAAETVERLLGQWFALLADAVARPEQRLGDLDALSAEERRQNLVELNATASGELPNQRIHERIARRAESSPDRTAVVFEGSRLTYGELAAQAGELADRLRRAGVGPGTLVGLCVERSLAMCVGIVGILEAGGAYVPLDPDYPADRLAFMLRDVATPLVVTQRHLVPRLEEHEVELLAVDDDRDDPVLAEGVARRERPSGDDLVYVIYTSGSTGRPKGVMITHDKLMISNSARVERYGEAPERFLLLSSFSFDSSVVGIFWTLAGGGTLVLVPEGVQKDVAEVARIVAAERISHLLALPSYYGLLLEQASDDELASLDTVVVAGEACPARLVEAHRRRVPQAALLSEYGATETTVFASVQDALAENRPIASLGRPIADAQMYVLDERLAPCPTGVVGEVHFGGPALALGYWNRPRLTAERFVPDPFSGRPGGRLYKSGDLARFLPTGEIEFLGRLDNQIKIRGYRVEMEEIEIALAGHPAVREAVVTARGEMAETKRLAAYLVTAHGEEIEVGELRRFLERSLPDYMVPSSFTFLDALPRTPNGKVDRAALPAPVTGLRRSTEVTAPRDRTEEILTAIWAEVLEIDRVGIDDNFFELGGDSILIIQIVARAQKAGLDLAARQVFEHQTVAELAGVAGEAVAGRVSASQEPVVGEVPLTPAARWFLDLGLPQPEHWNMPLLLEAASRIELGPLRRAVDELIRHHDMLRLRLVERHGDWVQEIASPPDEASGELAGDPPVERIDLTGLSPTEQDAEIERRCAQLQGSLDLAAGRVVRVALFERGPDRRQVLFLLLHHLVVDGVSWGILLEDLESLLDRSEVPAEALPAKTTSFKAWAERLEAHVAGAEPPPELATWPEAEGALVELPRDHPEGGNLEADRREVKVVVDAETTDRLVHGVPQVLGTQIADALVWALARALAAWTGSTKLWINLEGHGREEIFPDVDLSRTVGWFTSDVPLAVEVDRKGEAVASLAAVRRQLERLPRRGLAFGLWRYLGSGGQLVERLRALPRPEVGFNYLGRFDRLLGDERRFARSNLDMGATQGPAGERPFVLEVYGGVYEGKLEMVFEFGGRIHREETIRRLGTAFVESLEELVEYHLAAPGPERPAADFADFRWSREDLTEIAAAIENARSDS